MQAAMPIKDMATSTATVGLLRQLGSTVGVSVGQVIWASVSIINTHDCPFLGGHVNVYTRRSFSVD